MKSKAAEEALVRQFCLTGLIWSYRECFVMLVEGVAVLDRIDGNHLIPPAVDVLQPEQQTVAHLMEVLGGTHGNVSR